MSSRMCDARRHPIRVREGRLATAVEDASGTGPVCVLLHGRGDRSAVWALFAESIAADYRCLRVDLCGHGNSGGDPQGRNVALHLTRLLAQRTIGLVLVDSSPESDTSAAGQVSVEIRDTPERFASVEDYVHGLGERRALASRRVPHHLAAHALRRMETGADGTRLDRALGEEPPRDPFGVDGTRRLLIAVACPCLVVRGLGSAVLSPQIAKRMVQYALPRGTLATVAGAGYAVMTAHPDGFAHVVGEFRESLTRVANPPEQRHQRYCQ